MKSFGYRYRYRYASISCISGSRRVSDTHPFHADPDPWFEINVEPDEGLDFFQKFVFLR